MIEVVVFPCTYKCNGHCIMCTIYNRKEQDMSIDFFEPFFAHPELHNLKSINLTGGEPTLRKDLPELTKMIFSHCHSLKEIIINTNGFCTAQVLKQIIDIYDILNPGIKIWVYVSLDSVDSKAEIIRGVPKAHINAMKTIEKLVLLKRKLPNLQVGISCTITSVNYDKLEDVYQYASKLDIYVDFIYATINTAYINSSSIKDQFILNSSQISEVIHFFENLRCSSKISVSKDYYTRLIKNLKGDTTYKSCIFRERRGLLLEADGKISLCGMTCESLLGDLKESTMDSILEYEPLNIDKYCSHCQTSSYYNWTADAQQILQSNMFDKIRKIRKIPF